MYSAKIITENNTIVGFGYSAKNVFTIDPLTGVDVAVNTSQGFQQIGTTVESMSVGGLSRTIKGTFLAGCKAEAEALLHALPIFTKGKLIFNEKYWCEIVVSKTPMITRTGNHYSFSLMVYCATPFWYSTEELSYSMGEWTKTFKFPTSYDLHSYAFKNANILVDCYNDGDFQTAPYISFTADTSVTNFGLVNANTFEHLTINTVLEAGDVVEIYRDNTRLHVERLRGEVVEDIFEYLDEYTDLYWLHPGQNVLRMTAEDNVNALQCVVSFNAAYMGVLDHVS